MDDRHVLFGLHEMEGIGWKTIKRIERGFGERWKELLYAEKDELVALGLSARAATAVCSGLNEVFIEKRLAQYEISRTGIVTALDDEYPPLLKEIAQPPWVLYRKGSGVLPRNSGIAIVGTRVPTVYGRKMAFDLAAELSRRGVCVVSGLAKGIDSWAHRGALEGCGGTLAVLGCGMDTIYPPENASLYAEIAERGTLLTEYPLGTKLHPGLFPQRNRIISGLCLGTVIVEAAARSGSLITADFALEQSRDVFAVPGPATSPKSAGTLDLIRQGAKMAASAADILEEYASLQVDSSATDHTSDASGRQEDGSPDERNVLGHMAGAPITFDELLSATGLEFGHLHSVLLNLILTKRIALLPGSYYVAI